MARALISVPKIVRKGAEFEIKIIVSHPMETGYRVDDLGKPIARHIVKEFRCTYLDDEVFRAEMFPAISANPYFSFFAVAEKTGTVVLSWIDDRGAREQESLVVTVE